MKNYLLPAGAVAVVVTIVIVAIFIISGNSNGLVAATSYKNGTYTGDTVSNSYGDVQVQVTVANSKISDVQFLKSPSGGRSSMVSSVAIPKLTQEAISSQKANVDTVSGATSTSESFVQSLNSALKQAI